MCIKLSSGRRDRRKPSKHNHSSPNNPVPSFIVLSRPSSEEESPTRRLAAPVLPMPEFNVAHRHEFNHLVVRPSAVPEIAVTNRSEKAGGGNLLPYKPTYGSPRPETRDHREDSSSSQLEVDAGASRPINDAPIAVASSSGFETDIDRSQQGEPADLSVVLTAISVSEAATGELQQCEEVKTSISSTSVPSDDSSQQQREGSAPTQSQSTAGASELSTQRDTKSNPHTQSSARFLQDVRRALSMLNKRWDVLVSNHTYIGSKYLHEVEQRMSELLFMTTHLQTFSVDTYAAHVHAVQVDVDISELLAKVDEYLAGKGFKHST